MSAHDDRPATWGECAELLADVLLSTGERWTLDGPVIRGRAAALAGLLASGVLVADGDGARLSDAVRLADGWRKGAGL